MIGIEEARWIPLDLPIVFVVSLCVTTFVIGKMSPELCRRVFGRLGLWPKNEAEDSEDA